MGEAFEGAEFFLVELYLGFECAVEAGDSMVDEANEHEAEKDEIGGDGNPGAEVIIVEGRGEGVEVDDDSTCYTNSSIERGGNVAPAARHNNGDQYTKRQEVDQCGAEHAQRQDEHYRKTVEDTDEKRFSGIDANVPVNADEQDKCGCYNIGSANKELVADDRQIHTWQ